MKTQSLITLLACLLAACNQDDVGASNELMGKWGWESTCGGFAGCVHSAADNKMTLKISDTNIITTVTNKNGTNSTSSGYRLIDKHDQNGNTTYTLKLTNELTWILTVNKNSMSTGNDIFSTSYTRLQ